MIRQIFAILVVAVFRALPAWAQDTSQVISEMAQAYGVDTSGGIMGFSAWALFGAIVFGGVGFVAFVYGKKNQEMRPMLLGLVLMVYPYFVKQTFWLYVVGALMCAALYFWRE